MRGTFTAVVLLSTLTISPAMVNSDAGIYYRPFNLVYANQGGKTIPEDDTTIINALRNFPERPTMITDVLLNADPDTYATFIDSLKAITPNLFFALGKQADSLPADSSKLIALATKYSKYTTCIRIDHFQWLVQNSGDSAVLNYLTALYNLGFQNIMVNPWEDPQSGNGWTYVNAAQIGIDSDSWQARTDKIQHILAQSPGVTVVVNYENTGSQQALDSLGTQGSINAMAIAADAQDTSSIPYRWMPPWSHNYDPYQLNTLSWIADKLAEIDPEIGIEDKKVPDRFVLFAPAPNPSTGDIIIKYGLPKKMAIRLNLYALSGRLVKALCSETQKKGYYEINVSCPVRIPEGIYFISMSAGNYKETKKLILVK